VQELAAAILGDPAREESWTAATCPIPLPEGLKAGVYRVVEDTGRIAHLILTESVGAVVAESQTGAVDLPTVVVNSRRWYFIRLQLTDGNQRNAKEGAAAGTPACRDSEPIQTACANRKFDFTGYESRMEPSVTDAAEGVPEFRPETPALPEVE
jgi:hypothetical protein